MPLIVHQSMDAIAQAELLNLCKSATGDYQLTSLYLTDDFAVASHMGADLAVLRKDVIVEQGEAQSVIKDPQNDYTKHLVSMHI